MADPRKPISIDFRKFSEIRIVVSETLFDNMNLLYIFDPRNMILGSGTIAIGFGSKFRADSRYRDPEIFALRP